MPSFEYDVRGKFPLGYIDVTNNYLRDLRRVLHLSLQKKKDDLHKEPRSLAIVRLGSVVWVEARFPICGMRAAGLFWGLLGKPGRALSC